VAKTKTNRQQTKAIRIGARDLLWDYARLARMYGYEIVGIAAVLVVLSVVLEATSEDGWSWRWLGELVGITGLTGFVFFPLLRSWLRKGGLPSLKLPDAQPAEGPRMLAAAPSDWRLFAAVSSVLLFLGSAATLIFLVAVLGRGGTAEGVVIGVLLAWGFVTFEDGRRIQRTQAEENRMYWAAGQRPWGAGNRLVYTVDKS
jgi:hypothetical protein